MIIYQSIIGMGIILDLFLLVILIISIWIGYKKGLIDVAFSACAFIMTLLITLILYTPITNIVLEHTQFDEKIKTTIVDKGIIPVDLKKQQSDNKVSDYIKEYVTVPATEKANEAIDSTASIISKKIVSIGVAILIYIIIRIGLIFLKFFADAIAKLPIIKQCDKTGGIIYGGIRGVFIIYIILAIMFLVMSINDSGDIAGIINFSIVSKYLYTHNLILNIIF